MKSKSGIIRRQEPVRIQIEVGYQFPFHAAAPGKAILAFLPVDRQRAILESMEFPRFTDNTITDQGTFFEELAQVRALGYALDREELIDHVFCIGAPIFDHKSKVAAAHWITGPAFRVSRKEVPQMAAIVMETGLQISRKPGFENDL